MRTDIRNVREQMRRKTNPERLLFTLTGSKWTLAPHLVRLFPEHSIYVSAFGGTASEFVHKHPSQREVFNDLDGNIYSVFAVLRDDRSVMKLLRLLDNSHDSRRHYEECYDKLHDNGISLLERAYCFLICGNIGFFGRHPAIAKSYACGLPKKRRRLVRLPEILRQWRDRMKLVEVEHCDALDLITLYDSPKTLFYLDPPYHPSTRSKSLYLHDNLDQCQFVERLQRLQGKVLLCGYDNADYDKHLYGWRKICIATTKCMMGRQARTESVWMNYDERGDKLPQAPTHITGAERLHA